MKIIRQFTISSEIDLLSLDIIDFNRLNGVWNNAGEAMNTILSWFKGVAVATEVEFHNYFDAPMRDDFPSWEHVGSHEEVARHYWNWFWWNHENGELHFSDSPDFYGKFDSGAMFWGDIGKVSASAFAITQKGMKDHDLWITLKGDGSRQILIEPLISVLDIFDSQIDWSHLPGARHDQD